MQALWVVTVTEPDPPDDWNEKEDVERLKLHAGVGVVGVLESHASARAAAHSAARVISLTTGALRSPGRQLVQALIPDEKERQAKASDGIGGVDSGNFTVAAGNSRPSRGGAASGPFTYSVDRTGANS